MSCGAQQGVSQNQSSSSGVHGAERGASAVEAMPVEVSDGGAAGLQQGRSAGEADLVLVAARVARARGRDPR